MIAVADRRLLLPPGLAVPFTPPIVLAKSAVAVACPADITEDILATISIPAGAMGPNGMLRLMTQWTVNNNVNVKTLRARFGGIGGTVYLTTGPSTQVNTGGVVHISNRNAANSQIGFFHGINTAGSQLYVGGTTSAIDTSAATTLVITGQKAVAGDVLQLDAYLAELFYGA